VSRGLPREHECHGPHGSQITASTPSSPPQSTIPLNSFHPTPFPSGPRVLSLLDPSSSLLSSSYPILSISQATRQPRLHPFAPFAASAHARLRPPSPRLSSPLIQPSSAPLPGPGQGRRSDRVQLHPHSYPSRSHSRLGSGQCVRSRSSTTRPLPTSSNS
jgi:hypothetical protein